MKRFLCILLTVLLLTACIPLQYASAEQLSAEQIIRFTDGSYMVIGLSESVDSPNTSVRASKSGSKTANYYDNTGALAWTVTLTASFTYDGTTASCTSANVDVAIYNSSWYIVSRYAGWSGNTATANVTMAKTVTGTTTTVPVTLTLSCDANGNLY